MVTTYGYSGTTGELSGVTYSDGTPSLAYVYNRLGQTSTVDDYTGHRTFTYNLGGTLELQHEQLGSFYGDHKISRGYDTATGVVGRYNNLMVGTAASTGLYYGIGYGYDGNGRPNWIRGVSYAYTPNSNLISTVTDTWTSLPHTETRTYLPTSDTLDTIEGKWSTVSKARFDYGHDSMNRVTSVARTGEMFSRYGDGVQGLDGTWGYNDRSELTSEVSKLGGNPTVLTGRNDQYGFDLLGNRKTATHNSNVATYTLQTNGLNQYDNRTVPGIFDVAGGAPATATVTVNGSTSGVTRHGEYFFKKYALTNTSSPVFTALAVSDGTTTYHPAFLAKTPEVFTYDADGNLLGDGQWTYYYDAENRVSSIQTGAAAVAIGYPNLGFNFAYDYLGRRVLKYNYQWNGSVWQYTGVQKRYLYDGWNLLYELDGNASNLKLYVWGLDRSGSTQGAGGVGGLLGSYDCVTGLALDAVYDGNGNVVAMLNRADGSIAAAYEYDAFGKTIRESGPYADTNPFRFSTKYAELETGLVYYGHRYYSPSMGRFINKDPIGESGGLNLYGFCGNNGVGRWDYLGNSYFAGDALVETNAEYQARYERLMTGVNAVYGHPANYGWAGYGSSLPVDLYGDDGYWIKASSSFGGEANLARAGILNDTQMAGLSGNETKGLFAPNSGKKSKPTPKVRYGGKGGSWLTTVVADPVGPNRTAIPNGNDTLLGRVNNFVATVGGSTVTNALNASAPVATASLQGAAAFVDGAVNVVPFVNFTPLQSAGLYDPSQNGLAISQSVGGVTRDAALFLFGAAAWRALPVLGGGNISMQASLGLSAAGLTPLGVATSGTGTMTLMSSFLFVNGGRISTATGLIQHFDPDD